MFLNLTQPIPEFAEKLKLAAQVCFEACQPFYKQLADKYKSRSLSNQKNFMQPWMSSIYYGIKQAVIEEIRGSFEAALKLYHSIFAKYKQMIEDANGNPELKQQIVQYLRFSSDVCFLRLSFLLFRLNQWTEAEFGLFRYLHYFNQGLSASDQHLWRHNITRIFAFLLEKSLIWNPDNVKRNHGQAHFLVYSIMNAQAFLRQDSGQESYQVYEQLIADLTMAIESCPSKMAHLSLFLQLQLVSHYSTFGADEASKPFLEYLKTETSMLRWNHICKMILDRSLSLGKAAQESSKQIEDIWSLASLDGKFTNFEHLSILALNHNELSAQSALLNFAVIRNNLLLCSVKFCKRAMCVLDANTVKLMLFNRSNEPLLIESIGVFFNNEQVEPAIAAITEPISIPSRTTVKLDVEFFAKIITPEPLTVSFVTMQLKQPFLALQYGYEQLQSAQNLPHEFWDEFRGLEGVKFLNFCSSVLKRNSKCNIRKVGPKVIVNFQTNGTAYTAIPCSATIVLSNESDQCVNCELTLATDKFTILQDDQGKVLQQPIEVDAIRPSESKTISFKIKAFETTALTVQIKSRFDQSIDMRLANLYSMEATSISKQFTVDTINPFILRLKRNILQHRVTEHGASAKQRLKCDFHSTCPGFKLLDEPSFRIGDTCLKGKIFEIDTDSNESVANLSATFQVDSEVVQHTWPVTIQYRPKALAIYTSKL